MNANSTVGVVVEGGGEQVVAHVGLHALGSLADRLRLGDALSARILQPRFRLHDRGKVLVQAMLMLAGGGEACSDIERLRAQPSLFGVVASDSTLYRTIRSIDAAGLEGVWEAMAEPRAQVWRRCSATTGVVPVILDLDASLVDVHSENKEGTAANYKHGFGFSPMFCFADATGEALAGLLRPGNATANSIADQLAVLDAAIAQLPARIAAGHHRRSPNLASDRDAIPIARGQSLPKVGVFAEAGADVVAANIAAELGGRAPTKRCDGKGACSVEPGDGEPRSPAATSYATDAPAITLRRPGRHWHVAAVGFEKYWL